MATITHTEKKLRNWADKFETASQKMTACKDGIIIEAYHNTPDEFLPNPQVSHFRVRDDREQSEPETGYFAGETFTTVSSAIRFAEDNITRTAQQEVT